jgi:hypothetical protein
MQGPFRDPAALARALLAGPVTPARLRRFFWHAKKGTRPEFAGTLAALPPEVRAQVEAAGDAAAFRG